MYDNYYVLNETMQDVKAEIIETRETLNNSLLGLYNVNCTLLFTLVMLITIDFLKYIFNVKY